MNRLLAWILFVQPQLNFGQPNSKESPNTVTSHPNWKLLNFDQCGLSYADRIIGGKNASMGSYPWIARIGYVKKDVPENEREVTFRCGGSVISEYYIITAAHCVTNLSNNTLVSKIRLGEHNTETNPDCENSFCNDPYEEFEPVKIIHHEKYDTPKLRNDIALIRLDRKIKFTEFVKPICMMKGKLLKKNFIGQTAEVAGWGIYDINEPQMSTMLQTVKLPVVENTRCESGYRRVSTVSSQQMCVGGKVGQDSCGGDSGGPLMKVDVDSNIGPRYYIIGLVSFGAKLCGETNLPGVYTKISEYLLWILDHLEP